MVSLLFRIGKYSCQIGHSRFCFFSWRCFWPNGGYFDWANFGMHIGSRQYKTAWPESVFTLGVWGEGELRFWRGWCYCSASERCVFQKPLESKFKELQDKYKTPQNCKFLCVSQRWTLNFGMICQDIQSLKISGYRKFRRTLLNRPTTGTAVWFCPSGSEWKENGTTFWDSTGHRWCNYLLGPCLLSCLLKETRIFEARYCSGLSVCLQQIESGNNLSLWRWTSQAH